MALSPREYRKQRIEKLERELHELRDKRRSGLLFPWEEEKVNAKAKEISDEIEELKAPTALEKPAGIKIAYTIAAVFMVYGLLAESHGTFMFGVFALVVGLLGAMKGIDN